MNTDLAGEGCREPIRFGTDGWRAVMAEDFTFSNVARAARAAASFWKSSRGSNMALRVVVGGDRRFQSDGFARVVAEVFANEGFEVLLADAAVPTPAVSWAVRDRGCLGGIVITASHNPPEYNGLKLKAYFGGPASPAEVSEIEGCLRPDPATRMPMAKAMEAGRIVVADLVHPYLRALGKVVDLGLVRKCPLRIAHDAMHGVGAGCFEELLRGGRCRVRTLRGERDPLFGGVCPEPRAENYRAARDLLRREPADICLVTDGDADRLGLMDGTGRALTTHQAIMLVLHHLLRNRKERGRIVTTLNTTSMVPALGRTEGVPVTEVPIGFKHLCAEMLKGDVLAGVEESGSIGLARYLPERDGVLAGLLLLELMAWEGAPLPALLRRLEREFGPHRYGRRDIHVAEHVRARVQEFMLGLGPSKVAGETVADVLSFDGVKIVMRSGAWLMVRASGTEPVVRVYSEARTEKGLRALLDQGEGWLRTLEAGTGKGRVGRR